MSARIYSAQQLDKLVMFAVGGHKDAVVGVFFENNSLDMYTCSRDGAVIAWECNFDLEDIQSEQVDASEKVHYAKSARYV
ncbi:periodic tryptophan protein 2 homolog [Anneissia japonica]|uniref:periodic tryptophan protein 2 homolog n=1 Tax=Anneissia japonica TaxID=1529436 RepID=UPI0014258F87|nr:periodic tryptophan protein 2 homolog [Anneissia japonica]